MELGKVRVNHWWPGKEQTPIEPELIRLAEQRGSRYLTVATVELPGGERVQTTAFCCPKDVPTRRMGRRIALGRLQAVLRE